MRATGGISMARGEYRGFPRTGAAGSNRDLINGHTVRRQARPGQQSNVEAVKAVANNTSVNIS